MNPPFTVTINITEARQCHAAVSQLLRVFSSLSLTITENETIPASSRPPQTGADYPYLRDFIVECFASIYTRADPERFRNAIDKAALAGRLGANPDASTTRDEAALTAARCATPADAAPSYAWKPGEHTEAAADARQAADWAKVQSDVDYRNARIEAYVTAAERELHRGDDNADETRSTGGGLSGEHHTDRYGDNAV